MGGGAITAPPSRSALSDALAHQGLSALRTSSLSLSPASPSSPSGLSPSSLSPNGSAGAGTGGSSPLSTPRSALTMALQQAGLARPSPACA